ncbi:hypothetical protein WI697_27290 [Tistrella mobilis]|uniref:hypothetical protein n=1 Tax=Tistrella mobilis TaxID=171437 RepID=UPI0031F719CB
MEFGMSEIFRAQRRRWWMYFIVIPIFLGIAVIFNLLPHKYEAKMSVTAVQQTADLVNQGAMAASPLSFLGGGLSEKITKFQMYLNLLRSRPIAEVLMADPEILRALMDGRWDEETNTWRSGENIFDEWFGYAVPTEPTIDDVLKVLDNKIEIEQRSAPETVPAPIFDISIKMRDRQLAEKVLIIIHDRADQLVRDDELMHLQAWQNFLQNRISESPVLEARSALSEIYSNFYTRSIIAHSDSYFAAQFISPPNVSIYPVIPRPLIVFLLAFIMGGVVTFCFNFLKYTLVNMKRDTNK